MHLIIGPMSAGRQEKRNKTEKEENKKNRFYFKYSNISILNYF